ncbi:hypothetical protein OIU79_001016 [Salix purpurea]|uniref:Thioredoxin domain-containing protein n=1 Tax=Salix purpurea TaxID=77065 RepID=A0A9Q0V2M8_SALPP|nr:hypothetical protein OIU79_001016 [Salix purpurea]
MALQASINMSAMSPARAAVFCSNHVACSKEKLKLPAGRGLSGSAPLSSSFLRTSVRNHRSAIVCKAQEAVGVEEYAGKIACYKVNTDDCPNIASQYAIRSIPTVLMFKNGEKKEGVIGAVPKATFAAAIEKYI